MTEPGDPEDERLAPGIDSLRRRRAECPSAESLTRYAAGELTAGETAAIRDHIARCGVCDGILVGLREFDKPALDEAGWTAAERRIRTRVFPKPGRRVWLPHPAFAYACAAVALAAAFWPRHQPAPPAPHASIITMESVRTTDLNLTRGGGAGGSVLRPQDRFIVLSFQVDTRPGCRYAVSLDGGPSRDHAGEDGAGNFSLLFSREALGPGRHRLTVAEIGKASRATERSIEFPFEL